MVVVTYSLLNKDSHETISNFNWERFWSCLVSVLELLRLWKHIILIQQRRGMIWRRLGVPSFCQISCFSCTFAHLAIPLRNKTEQ